MVCMASCWRLARARAAVGGSVATVHSSGMLAGERLSGGASASGDFTGARPADKESRTVHLSTSEAIL